MASGAPGDQRRGWCHAEEALVGRGCRGLARWPAVKQEIGIGDSERPEVVFQLRAAECGARTEIYRADERFRKTIVPRALKDNTTP